MQDNHSSDRLNSLLALLRSKNNCLEGWMTETQTFIQQADPLDAAQTIALIDRYEATRERGVRSLDLLDRKIQELLLTMEETEKTQIPKQDFRVELARNELLVSAIFKADDVVFEKISKLQRDLAKKIAAAKQESETLQKFKSSLEKRGGGIDQNI